MKFKPGDRVVWKPNNATAHEGFVIQYLNETVVSVDLPTYTNYPTCCFEIHLTPVGPVERKRRGFATFIAKIEEKN